MRKYLFLVIFSTVCFCGFAQGQTDIAKIEEKLWNEIKSQKRLILFEQYLISYPKGSYRESAKKEIKKIRGEELKKWENAKKENSVESYTAFLDSKPQIDSLTKLANDSISELNKKSSEQKEDSSVEQSGNTSNGKETPQSDSKESLYLFFILMLLLILIGAIYLFLKNYKKMSDEKSKHKATKISLSEKIEKIKSFKISLTEEIKKYQENINYFNDILKTLGQEEQLTANHLGSLENADIDKMLEEFDAELSNISKQAKKMEEEYREKRKRLKEIEEETKVPTEQLAEKYKELAKKNDRLEKERSNVITNYEIPKDTYINANILVSAGPRKDKDNDTELGEDATGILNTPQGTYFWILDGTSDSPNIISGNKHIFSSRVLAQTMNQNIRDVLTKQSNESEVSLKEVLMNAVESSKKILLERIKSAPSELHNKIAEAVKLGNTPYCSTTVLLGFLSKGGELKYFYLGDSEVISFTKNGEKLVPNEKDENKNPSRLFVSIIKGDNDNSLILNTNSFEEKIVSFTKNNVDYLVAFSDGIGISEKSILENPKEEIAKISTTNQKTYDDKSLIILERIKHS